MGVDGISGGGIPPIPKPGAGESASATDAEFSVKETGETKEATALERLEAGDLSVDEYLETRVRHATEHLEGALAPDQLEMIREELRDQLSTDPVLQRLVQRTLGASAPEPSR